MNGNPLLTDGNGDGNLRRDIGAVEFQPAPAAPAADPAPGVTPPADPGVPATPSVADKTAPLVTGLKLRQKRFRFRLSEPATVRIRIKHGRRIVANVVRKSPFGANRLRVPRRLRAGRYSAIVTATDAAGNRSVAKRLRFRLTR